MIEILLTKREQISEPIMILMKLLSNELQRDYLFGLLLTVMVYSTKTEVMHELVHLLPTMMFFI
jgi:hypothetical protein